jgi:hypothetical protein
MFECFLLHVLWLFFAYLVLQIVIEHLLCARHSSRKQKQRSNRCRETSYYYMVCSLQRRHTTKEYDVLLMRNKAGLGGGENEVGSKIVARRSG